MQEVCKDAGMTRLRKLSENRALMRLAPMLWLGGFWLSSLGLLWPLFFLPASAQDAQVASPDALDSQVPAANAAPDPVPSAQELLLPAEPAATPVEPMPVEPLPAEPAAEPSTSSESSPGFEKSVDLELTRPAAPGEASGSGAAGSGLVNPNLAEQAESMFGETGSTGLIDNTPYSLGATDNPSVMLSERSTGCEATLQPGQTVPSSLCAVGSGDWGATAYGGGASVADMSLSVVYGRTTPSSKDFYNLTIRPPARLTSGKLNFLFPLSIPAAITSAFGWRLHPVMGESRFHSGTDLGAPQGTPVVAAFAGKVGVADFMGGYGLAVVVQHESGTEETLYGHLSEIFVKPGETVKQGEVIGRVGSTGLSTGPHLHFEFRKQTPQGWVVMDAGSAIEFALSQFVNALKLGQAYPPQLAMIRSASFTKALEMAEAKPDSQLDDQDQQDQLEAQPDSPLVDQAESD
jgi:murein DD-endopeptidase MepM/ murein hydrolase activator NlpD